MVWNSTIFTADNDNVQLVRHYPSDTLMENKEYLLPANCWACMSCNTTKCVLNKSSFDFEGCATKLLNCLFSSSKEFWDYRGDFVFLALRTWKCRGKPWQDGCLYAVPSAMILRCFPAQTLPRVWRGCRGGGDQAEKLPLAPQHCSSLHPCSEQLTQDDSQPIANIPEPSLQLTCVGQPQMSFPSAQSLLLASALI